MATITLPTGLTYQFIDPLFTVEQLGTMNALLAASLSAGPEKSALHRWLAFMFGNPRMSKATAEALLPLAPGEPSPFFETLDNLTQEGAAVVRGNVYTDTARITANLPPWLATDQMALLYAAGGDIEDEQVWFELDSLDGEVPASFPEKDGAETWATWGVEGSSHAPVQIGNKWYRSNQYGAGGVALKASEWVPYLLGGGTVVTKFQYMAILNS
jgi:hypothetical protein